MKNETHDKVSILAGIRREQFCMSDEQHQTIGTDTDHDDTIAERILLAVAGLTLELREIRNEVADIKQAVLAIGDVTTDTAEELNTIRKSLDEAELAAEVREQMARRTALKMAEVARTLTRVEETVNDSFDKLRDNGTEVADLAEVVNDVHDMQGHMYYMLDHIPTREENIHE